MGNTEKEKQELINREKVLAESIKVLVIPAFNQTKVAILDLSKVELKGSPKSPLDKWFGSF